MSNSDTPGTARIQSGHVGQRAGVPDAPDPSIRAVPDSEPFDEKEGDILGKLQVVGWRGLR